MCQHHFAYVPVIGSMQLQTDDCELPFIYYGTNRASCDFYTSSEGFKWCSKTANYDEDKEWTICEGNFTRYFMKRQLVTWFHYLVTTFC